MEFSNEEEETVSLTFSLHEVLGSLHFKKRSEANQKGGVFFLLISALLSCLKKRENVPRLFHSASAITWNPITDHVTASIKVTIITSKWHRSVKKYSNTALCVCVWVVGVGVNEIQRQTHSHISLLKNVFVFVVVSFSLFFGSSCDPYTALQNKKLWIKVFQGTPHHQQTGSSWFIHDFF